MAATRFTQIAFATVAAASLSACGINSVPTAEEEAKARWADVESSYQRRADLIPNLVNTVKGFAEQEKEVLTRVTEARSRVGQVQVNPSDPESLKRFEQAQQGLNQLLGPETRSLPLTTLVSCSLPAMAMIHRLKESRPDSSLIFHPIKKSHFHQRKSQHFFTRLGQVKP